MTIDNPPGRSSVNARIGTHPSFLAACLEALGSKPALAPLTTRDPGDPTIALLDAGAAMLDVLTFYRERITNEGYLGTAVERRSVQELARTIGYELNPGVAAGTWLAFRLETAEGSPAEVALAAGARAQSVPAQGEQPLTFETTSDLVARPELNELRGRTTAPRPPARGDTEVVIAGTGSRLVPGDRILLVGDERRDWWGSEQWDARIVVGVDPHEADPAGGPPAHTVLALDRPLGSEPGDPAVGPATKHPAVYPLRTRAALFGHNAIAWRDLPLPLRVGERHPESNDFLPGPYKNRQSTWADKHLSSSETGVWLDQPYDSVSPGSWLVLASADYEELYEVAAAVDEVHSDFLLSGPTTRVELRGERLSTFSPKDAVVWGGGERFPLIDPPRTAPIEGDRVLLDAHVEGIEPGRLVAVAGVDADSGLPAADVRTVIEVVDDDAGSELVLDRDLDHRLEPASVRVLANVAPATHGESWTQTLGDGDARRPWLRFTLANAPLTYTSAATPTGGESSLTVRVDGVAWEQVDTLHGAAPEAPVYTVRHGDDASATVEFGPAGRPPTGHGNITAAYRVGLGGAGNRIAAGAIATPLTRPLGLRSVSNPVAATGGADPEALADARRNAPLPILAMGRVVSLADFASFAAAFAGIAKARADAVWNGERRVVFLTVATEAGRPPEPGDLTVANLTVALDAARHAEVPVVVEGYEEIAIGLRAAIEVDTRRAAADVLAAADAALTAAFSFGARELARPVRVSEVLAALHAVAGVIGVVLEELHPVAGSGRDDVAALPARWAGTEMVPAQLAVVDPQAVDLTERGR